MNDPRHLIDLLGLTVPIIQAPMAGATTPAMVKGTMRAGGARIAALRDADARSGEGRYR